MDAAPANDLSIPSLDRPSPTDSNVSRTSPPAPSEGHVSENTRGRARRSPARPVLRTRLRVFSDMATILVGEEGGKLVKYLIHKELLTSASPFFAAALDGTFAEGMNQVVRLPEEKPEVFEWFLQWLYTGTLKTPAARCHYISNGITTVPAASSMHSLTELTEYDIRTDGDLRNSQGSPKYFLLLDLYALSDRLLTTPLSNHIVTTIARLSESTNSVPTPSDTWILYDTIRDSASIRTLTLDLFAYKKTDRLLETHKDEWHPRFLRDLCVKLKRPGPEAIERHSLVAWRPASWSSSKACELCKEILQPGVSGDKCCGCEKVFCASCLRHPGKGLMQNDASGCKPWAGRGMCLRYHEHVNGEACG